MEEEVAALVWFIALWMQAQVDLLSRLLTMDPECARLAVCTILPLFRSITDFLQLLVQISICSRCYCC